MFSLGCILCSALPLLTNAVDVARSMVDRRTDRAFELTGSMTYACSGRCATFGFADSSGFVVLRNDSPLRDSDCFQSGDLIRVCGQILNDKQSNPSPSCSKIEIIGHGTPPEPMNTTIAKIHAGEVDCRPIAVRGTVRDVFTDEIDPEWTWLTLNDGKDSLFVVCRTGTTTTKASRSTDDLSNLIDAKVEIRGLCQCSDSGTRSLIRHIVLISGAKDVTVLEPPAEAFSVPELVLSDFSETTAVKTLGRRRSSGTVIALWNGNHALVRRQDGTLFNATFMTTTPPSCGDSVEISGLPEFDCFQVNLTSAVWRRLKSPAKPDDAPPIPISADDIFRNEYGHEYINSALRGKLLRLEGLLQRLPADDGEPRIVQLSADGRPVPVDFSSAPDAFDGIDVGSRIAVTGVGIAETESWHSFSRFPHIVRFQIAIRRADDVRLLARPPWWTPARLMVVIATLLLVILASLAWIRTMRRLVNRRSRQLARERVARAEADLRRDERTRLAVELHDSLSQNLAGLACQFAAMRSMSEGEPNPLSSQLSQAEAMLASSRIELKRCLHDLRNETLDCRTFGDAIRKSVSVPDGTKLFIRFNAPISRVSDTLAHSALSILRELVSNATVHGRARNIRIAGSVQDGTLSFSVRDDGVGFRPEEAPGVAFGHFGLEGIRERVARNAGRFTLESKPGGGCTARVDFPLPDA